jgi:metal-responsive CopG/Arc/MetJ family transcriptional regulator
MTATTSDTYGGRMPRLHVTLPQDLFDELRSHGWSPSELLREAVRERLDLEEREREWERWHTELVATLGPPTPEEQEIIDRLLASAPETGGDR